MRLWCVRAQNVYSTTEAAARVGAPASRDGAELLLATPDWLYCLVGRWTITAYATANRSRDRTLPEEKAVSA